MNQKNYQKEKDQLLAKSKNKGLDMWEAVLKNYKIDIEKAKTSGVYVHGMGHVTLYFDTLQDKWLMKPTLPSAN